jgi:hypothetical protein
MQRPELAIHIGEISALYNEIEARISIMVYNKRDFIEIGDRLRAAYEELRVFSAPFVTQAFGHSFLPTPTKPRLDP